MRVTSAALLMKTIGTVHIATLSAGLTRAIAAQAATLMPICKAGSGDSGVSALPQSNATATPVKVPIILQWTAVRVPLKSSCKKTIADTAAQDG